MSEIPAPATVGVLRHVILIPATAESWDEESLRQIFEHELAHVQRYDGLVDLVGALAAVAHWYHPLVHRAIKAMAVERERACDDVVLMAGAAPRTYAKLLLVNAAALDGGASLAPTLAFAAPSELETRLRAVLDEDVPRERLARRTALACCVVGALATLLVSAIRVEARPPDATPSFMTQPVSDVRNGLDADSSRRLPALEPDLRGDSVASPRSERLELPGANRVQRSVDLRSGPDASFAEVLAREAARVPTDDVDLVPERAAWALGIVRDGRLIEPLVDLVEDRDWRVRAHAAWALGVAGQTARRDSRAQPRLVRALEDPVWRVRAAATFALRSVGDSAVIPALTRALGDAAWQVRAPAVEGLATIGGARTHGMLEDMLHDRHSMVRETAATALAPVIATSRE